MRINFGLHKMTIVPYVQGKLLYKKGHYFLDILYDTVYFHVRTKLRHLGSVFTLSRLNQTIDKGYRIRSDK